jgi:hypothetical protein
MRYQAHKMAIVPSKIVGLIDTGRSCHVAIEPERFRMSLICSQRLLLWSAGNANSYAAPYSATLLTLTWNTGQGRESEMVIIDGRGPHLEAQLVRHNMT